MAQAAVFVGLAQLRDPDQAIVQPISSRHGAGRTRQQFVQRLRRTDHIRPLRAPSPATSIQQPRTQRLATFRTVFGVSRPCCNSMFAGDGARKGRIESVRRKTLNELLSRFARQCRGTDRLDRSPGQGREVARDRRRPPPAPCRRACCPTSAGGFIPTTAANRP